MGWGFLGTVGGAITGAVGGAASAVGGSFTDEGVVQWATLSRATSPGDVFRAAKAHNPAYEGIAALSTPVALGKEVANWVYLMGNQWKIPTQRFGQDNLAGDNVVQTAEIDGSTITTDQGTGVGGTGGTGATGGTNGGGLPMDAHGFVFGRVQPRMIQQRRCPPGMRLARDGWCYPTKILPRAARANIEKKAPVSWSDANHIRKGRSAQKRIQMFSKAAAKDARELQPPTRRRRSSSTGDKLSAAKLLKLLGKGD